MKKKERKKERTPNVLSFSVKAKPTNVPAEQLITCQAEPGEIANFVDLKQSNEGNFIG